MGRQSIASQREAIHIPAPKVTFLDEMSEEDIKTALSTRPKPYIPPELEIAILDVITAIDEAVVELETVSADWVRLETPDGAETWREAQLQFLDSLRQAYLWIGVAKFRLLELGEIPNDDADRMLTALETSKLARELADRYFDILYAKPYDE